jgi:hypothetical protein
LYSKIHTKISWMVLLTLFVMALTALPASADTVAADNDLAAVALYIDTTGHYIPGMDMLNKALNDVIRFKLNLLMLGSEVQSGDGVLRDLSDCNIHSAGDATLDSLGVYGAKRHVNYVVLFSVRPWDVALDFKAYSTAANDYIMNKTVTRPDGDSALSTLDSLSNMIGSALTDVFQLLKGSTSTTPAAQ